jgi:8-oxo-dGTP diphosphatase
LNPFESGERKVIPAVLIYARRPDGRVLMIHRNAPDRPGDYHAGKWNGLGGKLELDESPQAAARRELLEESGLNLPADAFVALGVLQFPNFKAHQQEDWVCWVFTARVPEGLELSQPSGPEGDLHWVAPGDLAKLNLWPGDRHFIGYVAEEKPFLGTIWYAGQHVVKHEVVGLL